MQVDLILFPIQARNHWVLLWHQNCPKEVQLLVSVPVYDIQVQSLTNVSTSACKCTRIWQLFAQEARCQIRSLFNSTWSDKAILPTKVLVIVSSACVDPLRVATVVCCIGRLSLGSISRLAD